MNLNTKRVLITGAGGFIGSHLAEKLTEEGCSVRALVHYNALGGAGWLDRSACRDSVEVVFGDLCDQDSVAAAVSGQDVVFHLGALIAIPYSYIAPRSYIRTNIEGTFNILQAARQHSVSLVVHTSTSEVYGTADFVPINEAHPLKGQSPYSASKIGADKMAEAFYLSFDVPVVTVRPFNTFGPRQSIRAVIPTIITQLMANQPLRLGHLYPTRDLNYVDDTVRGFLLAAQAPEALGQVINLGCGREIAIGDLAALIAKMMSKPTVFVEDPLRLRPNASEVDRLLADNTKARELLGWSPRFTLEEALSKTISWIAENKSYYRTESYAV